MKNVNKDLFTKEFYNWSFEPRAIFQVCIINLGNDISFYLDVNMYPFPTLLLSKISLSLIHYKSVYSIIILKLFHYYYSL